MLEELGSWEKHLGPAVQTTFTVWYTVNDTVRPYGVVHRNILPGHCRTTVNTSWIFIAYIYDMGYGMFIP